MAVLAFIVVSVATPITRWQAFIAYFLAIFAVSLVAKIPTLTLLTRALIEIPFIFFAILMPFFGEGEKFSVFGLELYRDGLLAGTSITWNSLKWCIEEKYSTFDMGGENPFPDSSKEKSIDFFRK